MPGESVWVLPRQDGGTDAHGNPTHTWPDKGDAEAVEVEGATVAPRPGSEGTDAAREAVIVGLNVYLPAGTRMDPVDRMWVRGDVYDVVGDPGVWVNPWTQQERGVQVALELREG